MLRNWRLCIAYKSTFQVAVVWTICIYTSFIIITITIIIIIIIIITIIIIIITIINIIIIIIIGVL
ncbi:hypothetical protein PP707_03410 [Acetobacter pasteurianus]|nr:hypothetical protein [Acetobacter pasteurianus]